MKGLYGVLAFILGAGIGGYVSYVTAKDHFLKQADTEIASMREVYEKKLKKIENEKADLEKSAKEAHDTATVYEKAIVKLGAEKYKEGSTKRPTMADNAKKDDESEKDSEDDIQDPDDHIIGTRPEPEIIFEEQFAEEYCGVFDKVTLHYYPEDGILCTEDNELVDNLDYTVGKDWLDSGLKIDDEIFVRNKLTGTDYMIVVCAGLGSDHLNYDD